VLTFLEQCEGIESSYVNERSYQNDSSCYSESSSQNNTSSQNDTSHNSESDFYFKVYLRPGADPKKVAENVQRILRRTAWGSVRVAETVSGTTLPREQWRDKDQVASSLAAQKAASAVRWSWLLVLLLLCAAVCLGLLLLWDRYKQAGKAARPVAASLPATTETRLNPVRSFLFTLSAGYAVLTETLFARRS
jgi:hypothetical protein